VLTGVSILQTSVSRWSFQNHKTLPLVRATKEMYGGWRPRCLLYLSKGEWSCQLKPLMSTHMVALCSRCVASHLIPCQSLCWPRAAVLWTWTLCLANTSSPRYCSKSRRSGTLPSIHWRRRCTQEVFIEMYICQLRRSTSGLSDCRVLVSRIITNMNELA